MPLPDFIAVNEIPFDTWVGTVPIYILTTDSSGIEINSIVKVDIDLIVSLSAIDSSHTGVVKINFINESIGITPFSVKFGTLKRYNCTHKGVIILDPFYLILINSLFNVILGGLLSFVKSKDLLYLKGLSLCFM